MSVRQGEDFMTILIRTIAVTIILASSNVSQFAQNTNFVHPTSVCTAGFVSTAPLDVEKEFNPSGWMGDGEKGKQYVQMTPVASEKVRAGDENGQVTRIRYQPGPVGWAGVYWL